MSMNAETRDMPPPQDASPQPEEVRFAPFRIFSRRFATTLFSFLLGVTIGVSMSSHGDNGGYDIFVGAVSTLAFAVVMLFSRLSIRRKGGIPPLRFFADRVEVPINTISRKTRSFAYADILSASVYGKGKRRRIVFDTKKRAFVYPLRDFDDETAGERIVSLLRQHISALPGGAAQWQEVEKRQTVATVFTAFRPRATWLILAVITAVFILQMSQTGEDLLRDIDMGANVPLLVVGGEWYRLVTGNLLHAGIVHFYCNAIFCLIIGTLVERQLGSRRFLILVLATGIVSHVASAAWQLYGAGGHLFSVGISGALFGMLGAQAVLNRKFGGQLPGGYRFTQRSWFLLLGINFIAVPLLVPQVDTACHLGGFVAGIIAGALLCRGQDDILKPLPLSGPEGMALGLLSAACIGAMAQGVRAYTDATVRQGDHIAFLAAVMAQPKLDPDVGDLLAWAVAREEAPSAAEIAVAQKLADKARAAAKTAVQTHVIINTSATLAYRAGELKQALELEMPLVGRSDLYAGQAARFLDAYVHKNGIYTMNGAPVTPVLGVAKADARGVSVAVSLPAPAPAETGLEIYAVVKQDGSILGLADISVAPGASGGAISLPRQELLDGGWSADGHDIQVTPAATDATDCGCEAGQNVSVHFTPFASELSDLP